MKPIYADFMKIDYENRLILSCLGTFKDLERYEIKLEPGMQLLFYNEDENENGNRDDLVVEGIVSFDDKNKRWVAKVVWEDIKNISQLSAEEKQRLQIE